MNTKPDDSQVLDYFEVTVKTFIIKRLSDTDNWWNALIPPEIRDDAFNRYMQASNLNDILNKPDYKIEEYLNFDGYEKIMSRRDNWRDYFETVFVEKSVFVYKMHIILSLRNDIRHGRKLDRINRIRLRLHCYDILSQIKESDKQNVCDYNAIAEKLGL